MVNGRAGKGTRHFDKDEAVRLAEELNREYPQIHHEAVPVERGQVSEPASTPSELVHA